jgi:multiple sugar transport system permease protein
MTSKPTKTMTMAQIFPRILLYLALCFGAFLMSFPFLWMIITSFHSKQESAQAQPVWLPQRAQPANWLAASGLGSQGGDGWWGGLASGKSVRLRLDLSDSAAQPLATIPSSATANAAASGSLFSDTSSESADLRQVTVIKNADSWLIEVKNTGTEFFEKVPLRIVLPDGVTAVAELPADAVRREDIVGVTSNVLEWSNVTPGFFGYLLENYRDAVRAAPFGRYFLNSLINAFVQTLLGMIVVTLAAFAFARIDFFGRDLLFALLLSSLMIPGEVLLVPNYVITSRLDWLNSYQGLIVPWIASVFGMFLLRQFFLALPTELFEAARIDGAGYGTMLWRVGLPLAVPGLVTFGLFAFLGSWNSLLWPLIITNKPEMRTLQVGLQAFIGEAGTDYGQLMAASLLVILPIIIGYFLAQKQFIAGVARSGLK